MRFIFSALSTVMLITLSCGGSTAGTTSFTPPASARTVTYAELTDSPDSVSDDMAEGGAGIIIKIEKGQKVPVTIVVDLPGAKMTAGENAIEFDRDIYYYVSRKAAALSGDGVHWETINGLETFKSVLGISRGSLEIGMGLSKNGPNGITVSLKGE